MIARVHILRTDETTRVYASPLTREQAANLQVRRPTTTKAKTEIRVFEQVLVAHELDHREIRGYRVSLASAVSGVHIYKAAEETPEAAKEARSVGRCRSILGIAKVVLPRDVCDDAVDEWMDEIECAAAENRPVLRRTISIVVRSLPLLAWRSRVPMRVRKPGRQ
jgi:hypothetical protein